MVSSSYVRPRGSWLGRHLKGREREGIKTRRHLKGFVLAHLIRSRAFLTPWRLLQTLAKKSDPRDIPYVGFGLPEEVHTVYETGIFALKNRWDFGVERTSSRTGRLAKNKRTKKQTSKTPNEKADRQN